MEYEKSENLVRLLTQNNKTNNTIMKTAQLIKETVNHLYKDENGEILNLTAEEKLMYSIFRPDLCLSQKTEEIVGRWRYRTKKEVDKMYWDFIKENNVDPSEYYIIYTEQ
jgi:hypothetical protein